MQDIPPVHRLVFEGQRLLKRLVDALGNVVCIRRIGVLQQDGELIATQPRHHVIGRTHLLAQALGHGLQKAVAKGIASTSFTCLKRSRSSVRTASGCGVLALAAMACTTASRKRARLGRPVRRSQ